MGIEDRKLDDRRVAFITCVMMRSGTASAASIWNIWRFRRG